MNVTRCLALCALILAPQIATAYQSSDQPTPIYMGPDEFRLAPRTALVIPVDKVAPRSGIRSLQNPRNDAADVTRVLRDAKFLTINLGERLTSEHMTKQAIKIAVYDFARALKASGGVGLIYFAGHGISRQGQMYLFPYDAYVGYQRDFEEELISETFLLDAFSFAGSSFNLLIIDACRDFPESLNVESFGTTAVESLNVDTKKKTFYAYATVDGSPAADGTGSRSPFATAFTKAFKKSDVGLSKFFSLVGLDLTDSTYDAPNINQVAGAEFVFMPTVVTFNEERAVYNSAIGGDGNRSLLDRLLKQYPAGYFYAAASALEQRGNLAPIPPVSAPDTVATIVKDGNARSMPALDSAVVAKVPSGLKLPVVGPEVNGWIPVQVKTAGAAGGDLDVVYGVAYVPSDLVKISQTRMETLELKFTGSGTGQVSLDKASVDALKKLRLDHIVSSNVVGLVNADGDLSGNPSILARQAAALGALHKAGVDTTNTQFELKSTNSAESHNTMSVEIHTLPAGNASKYLPALTVKAAADPVGS
jgi:hypothetical protein